MTSAKDFERKTNVWDSLSKYGLKKGIGMGMKESPLEAEKRMKEKTLEEYNEDQGKAGEGVPSEQAEGIKAIRREKKKKKNILDEAGDI